jgi:hypothetical protein
MPQAVDIDALLRRDQYEQVVFPPQVGDIVVYRMGTEIMHTGFVSSVRRLSDQSAALIIFVYGVCGEGWVNLSIMSAPALTLTARLNIGG